MSVIIQYVVERNGEEKMTFTSKTDADAYDKMLDMADELFELLAKSDIITDETQCEALSFFLAQNREEVLCALGTKRKVTSKNTNKIQEDTEENEELIPSENEEKAA